MSTTAMRTTPPPTTTTAANNGTGSNNNGRESAEEKKEEAHDEKTTTTFQTVTMCCADLKKFKGVPILTGVGFLDHMIDQMNSHAQIGIGMTILLADKEEEQNRTNNDDTTTHPPRTKKQKIAIEDLKADRNRLAQYNQTSLMEHVGQAIGKEIHKLLQASFQQEVKEHHNSNNSNTVEVESRFSCPLDEALVDCVLRYDPMKKQETTTTAGLLSEYNMEPYGIFPKNRGRKHIGKMETKPMVHFWSMLAQYSGLDISLRKRRGHNGHHIIESAFKAFSRAIRNLLDRTSTVITTASNNNELWGEKSANYTAGLQLQRKGILERGTKETSISVQLYLDGGAKGIQVQTGIEMLNEFLIAFATAAQLSLHIQCHGDLWVDEHHTAEDISIALGQVIVMALGDKAGLNRMWSCAVPNNHEHTSSVKVTMDLSNRPYFHHNLQLHNQGAEEYIEDLTIEMFEHVLDSLVLNARMTVHVVQERENEQSSNNLKELVLATARAFGETLYYCAMVDCRRAGQTASSKGTLSV